MKETYSRRITPSHTSSNIASLTHTYKHNKGETDRSAGRQAAMGNWTKQDATKTTQAKTHMKHTAYSSHNGTHIVALTRRNWWGDNEKGKINGPVQRKYAEKLILDETNFTSWQNIASRPHSCTRRENEREGETGTRGEDGQHEAKQTQGQRNTGLNK